MLPDRVSNPGPLTYESGALPIALRGPALVHKKYEPHQGKMCLTYLQAAENQASLLNIAL